MIYLGSSETTRDAPLIIDGWRYSPIHIERYGIYLSFFSFALDISYIKNKKKETNN